MKAIAISGTSPLSMLGGVAPMKGARGVPSFVNLFSAFESKTSGFTITAAAPTKTTATSKQIADAIIRSMLGTAGSAPVVTAQASVLPEMQNGDAAASQGSANADSSNNHPGQGADGQQNGSQTSLTDAQPDPGVAQKLTDGDAMMRSMLGLQSGPTQQIEQESAPAAMPEPNSTLQAPIGKGNEAVNQDLPQGSSKNRQSAARVQTIPTPGIAQPEVMSVLQPNTAVAPQTSPVMTPSDAPKPDAPPTRVSSAMPNVTRTIDVAAASIPQPTGDAEAIERTVAPTKDSDTPAPLAFSADLTPILPGQTAQTMNSAVVAATPGTDLSQVPQSKNAETPVTAGVNEKALTVGPEQRGSGNGAGRDDRPPERDDSSKNDAPARAMQASAGAGDFSRGWTTTVAPVTPENTTETAAGPAAEAVRTEPGADAATQLAEANSPAALKSFQSPTVQEIAVRIERPEMASVDLHVTERAGEIHIAVRTSDLELQTSLRQDLGSLSSSLERAGYHAETFVPRAAAGSQMNLREERQAQQGFSGRGGSQSESGSGKQKGQREQRGGNWLQELEQSK